MIKSLKLKNFRNFSKKEFFFSENKNIIVGKNGKGKTNILESLSLITLNDLTKIDFKNLVKKDENIFYIEAILKSGDCLAISYEKEKNKKNYFLNGKKFSKSKIKQNNLCCGVNFSPSSMNMLYLSPSLRRDFLDSMIASSFPEYQKYFKKYKEILKNRNKLLKNIKELKSQKDELSFWNEKFAELCEIIYNYRFGVIDYLKKDITKLKKYFLGKVDCIEIIYKTKVEKDSIKEDILKYLEKNLNRDIILTSTQIGPHIDDFEILVDGVSVVDFASRGEIKSIILELKLAEMKFIEKYSNKKPILLIDDLFSELDTKHKEMFLEKLSGYQTFISSIEYNNEDDSELFYLN